jgi:hypothetical protein
MQTQQNPSKLLDSKETAELLRTTPGNLSQWRHKRFGPPFIRSGRKCLYRLSDVERWLAQREVSTFDENGKPSP